MPEDVVGEESVCGVDQVVFSYPHGLWVAGVPAAASFVVLTLGLADVVDATPADPPVHPPSAEPAEHVGPELIGTPGWPLGADPDREPFCARLVSVTSWNTSLVTSGSWVGRGDQTHWLGGFFRPLAELVARRFQTMYPVCLGFARTSRMAAPLHRPNARAGSTSTGGGCWSRSRGFRWSGTGRTSRRRRGRAVRRGALGRARGPVAGSRSAGPAPGPGRADGWRSGLSPGRAGCVWVSSVAP